MPVSRKKRRSLTVAADKWLSPFVFGLAAWLVFPSIAARADLAALLTGIDGGGAAWRMVLTDSPAGSIQQAELTFADLGNRKNLASGAGMVLPDGRRIALASGSKGREETPDETRVNRAAKKGRIVAVEQVQPPRAFTAGTIDGRSASLILGAPDDAHERVAFLKPERVRNLEVATFYKAKPPVPTPNPLPVEIARLVNNPVPDSLATAYAPPAPDFARQSPFDAILKPENDGRFTPKIGPQDHDWAANVLPPSVFSPAEQQCLASGVYFEARGESAKGQAAVAQVILNRVRNPAYPDTVCGVVYQNEDWRNRCQFSFACDAIRDRVGDADRWKMARDVSMAVTAGKIWLPEVGSATHYHAIYVRPAWARTMEKVGRIGLHVFYRTYGGGWI